jgi:hypothetical protein
MNPKNQILIVEADQHPNRLSLRLKGYDYAQAGAYFVTICTQGRVCLFGEVVDGAMRWNAAHSPTWRGELWLAAQLLRTHDP